MFTCHFLGRGAAGLGCLPVNHNGAGTAGAFRASVLDRMKVQIIPQVSEKLFVLRNRTFEAINKKSIRFSHFLHPSAHQPPLAIVR